MRIPHLLFLVLLAFLALTLWNAARKSDAEAEAESDSEWDSESEPNQETESGLESGQGKSHRNSAADEDPLPLAGPRLMAMLQLMDLSTRLNRATIRTAAFPEWEPFTQLGREKRIILEQLRISQQYQSEFLRHWQRDYSGFASSDAEWALTAANLSLSFAERRVEWLTLQIDSRKSDQ